MAETQRGYELVCIFRKTLPKSADDPVLSGHVPGCAADCSLFPEAISRSGKLISFVRALTILAPLLLMRSSWAVSGDILENVPFCSLCSTAGLLRQWQDSPHPIEHYGGRSLLTLVQSCWKRYTWEDFMTLPYGGGISSWLKIHPSHMACSWQGVPLLLSLDNTPAGVCQSELP